MSKFRRIVEDVLQKHKKANIRKWLEETTTLEHVYHIFHLNKILVEDKDETKNSLWLAQQVYNQILDKIDSKDYQKTQFGGIIHLDIPELDIEFSLTGREGDGFFSKQNNEIVVYAEDLNSFKDNETLETALIHEIAHSMSYDDMNNFSNYIKPEENREKYLTQPLEFEANKVALCNYIVKKTLKELKNKLSKEELYNRDLLRKHIDEILYDISQNQQSFYYEFLNAVHKDKKVFKELYFEIMETCIEYIQEHLSESYMQAASNDRIKENIYDLPNITPEESIKRICENLDKNTKTDYIKEFRENCQKLEETAKD